MIKDVQIYFIWVNKDLFGCFRYRGERDNDHGTGLKEGGGIEMSTTSAFPYTRCSLSSLCIYLPLPFPPVVRVSKPLTGV